jgi:hypothetical protein
MDYRFEFAQSRKLFYGTSSRHEQKISGGRTEESRFRRDCLPMIREKRDRKILVDRKQTPEQRLTFYIFVFGPKPGKKAPTAGISQSQSPELSFNGTAENTRWQKFLAQRGVGEINSRTFA